MLVFYSRLRCLPYFYLMLISHSTFPSKTDVLLLLKVFTCCISKSIFPYLRSSYYFFFDFFGAFEGFLKVFFVKEKTHKCDICFFHLAVKPIWSAYTSVVDSAVSCHKTFSGPWCRWASVMEVLARHNWYQYSSLLETLQIKGSDSISWICGLHTAELGQYVACPFEPSRGPRCVTLVLSPLTQ